MDCCHSERKQRNQRWLPKVADPSALRLAQHMLTLGMTKASPGRDLVLDGTRGDLTLQPVRQAQDEVPELRA